MLRAQLFSEKYFNVVIEFLNKEANMALSARNVLKGTVKEVKKGMVMAEVVIEIAPGVEVVSSITTSSVEKLGLDAGKSANVVIKATSVMLDA